MGKAPTDDQRSIYACLRGSYKRIEEYTDEELEAVKVVVPSKYPAAWELLNFVDCYFEARKRKQAAENGK